VFTTWGALCWLPDLGVWARAIASALAPGGELYCADAHPGLHVLEEIAGKLAPTYDFRTTPDRPLPFADSTVYPGDPAVVEHRTSHVWMHPFSVILGGLIDAGMTISMFHEHEVLPWQMMPMMAVGPDRLWRLPAGHPRIPLSFSLRARKANLA
jgi:hypothetical protein